MPGIENFLKKIRENRGFTISELARRAKVSKQLITGFEKGRNRVSDGVLINLANILDVKPEEIIPGKDATNIDKAKKYFLKAIKITDEYYGGEDFDEDLMIDIGTEVYNFLITVERNSDINSANKTRENITKELNKRFVQGLAAKCFLEYFEESHKKARKEERNKKKLKTGK